MSALTVLISESSPKVLCEVDQQTGHPFEAILDQAISNSRPLEVGSSRFAYFSSQRLIFVDRWE